MATITKTLGGDLNGSVTYQVDYDDLSMYLLVLRCINTSDQAAYGTATLTSDPRRTASATFPAGQTTEISLPTGAQNRLGISMTPSGKIDGVEYHFNTVT